MRRTISKVAKESFNFPVAFIANLIIVGLLAALAVGGVLTPRGFGITGLAALILCGLIWYVAAKSVRPLNTSVILNQGTKTNDKGLYIRVAVVLVLLAFGATAEGPWWPKLIGASVLMLYLIGTLRARRFPT